MDKHEEKFWRRVDRSDSNACWEFPNVCADGYGIYCPEGIIVLRAHRYAWEITRGCKAPEGMYILHLCNNRPCVNPSHLYCGSARDNAQDRSRSAHEPIRCQRIAFTKAKFHAGEIWLIRRLKGIKPSRFVAMMFKCDKGTILNIWTNPNWPCKEGYYA